MSYHGADPRGQRIPRVDSPPELVTRPAPEDALSLVQRYQSLRLEGRYAAAETCLMRLRALAQRREGGDTRDDGTR